MRILRFILAGAAALILMTPLVASANAAKRKSVESGKTQVVAKLNHREITISDLRAEMGRLGLSANDEYAERAALESIVNRALLADAARDANLHRQPEALRRIAVAQEQTIADLYLAAAAHPPEPTRAEIEDFITANPALFGQRRVYNFSILTMPTPAFDEEKHAPLFNQTVDFGLLEKALDQAGVAYSLAPAVQPSTSFPQAIRQQLSQYAIRDNIVLKGGTETQIMKITGVKRAPAPSEARPAIARQVLLQKATRERAQNVVERLRQKSQLAYYRKSAAPATQEGE